jgi:RNA polymerase sigma-70 factor (ECF subfamily)
VAAFVHLHQFAGRALFSTWLTRIAVHEALARARRRDRELPSRPSPVPAGDGVGRLSAAGPDPEQQALDGERQALLKSAIATLPLDYRLVLLLRGLEGMSTAETARRLSLSTDVVKTRFCRARRRLRDTLARRL